MAHKIPGIVGVEGTIPGALFDSCPPEAGDRRIGEGLVSMPTYQYGGDLHTCFLNMRAKGYSRRALWVLRIRQMERPNGSCGRKPRSLWS
jgi:hypothetical protein